MLKRMFMFSLLFSSMLFATTPIRSVQSSEGHMAYWNAERGSHSLLITLGGTKSKPEDLQLISRSAVELGYAVLSVSYPNSVITVICRKSENDLCFDEFREEIVFGRDVSKLVQVDARRAIFTNILQQLRLLSEKDARWKSFFENGNVNWGKVVLLGHSQGAGHAAYLAKRYAVKGAVLIGGPQDYFLKKPAPWLSGESKTNAAHFRALLHAQDPFDSEKQRKAFHILTNGTHDSNITLSNKETLDPHNALISDSFKQEWKSLLAQFVSP